MRRILIYSFLCTISCLSALSAKHSPHGTVISFDLDDVISLQSKIGVTDYLGLSRAILWNPKLLTAFFPSNFKKISEDADLITKRVNGSFNVVHIMLEKLKAEGYGDLFAYEDEIIRRSIKPIPIRDVISYIKKLKAEGYTVVAATNQDHKHHQIYRAKMKRNHAINLNTLFDAVLTTEIAHEGVQDKGSLYQLHSDHNIYVISDYNHYKPKKQYFEALKQLASHINPGCKRLIHIDDRKENVEGAIKAGLQGVHFALAGGSAKKTSPKGIDETVSQFKQDLSSLGVAL